MDAVVERWERFLAQIRTRFQDLMREASVGCAALLEQSDFNTVAMSKAWHAMEMRAKELSTKVEETWSQQVVAAFSAASASAPVLAREREKGTPLRDWMEIEIERTRTRGVLRRLPKAARACPRAGGARRAVHAVRGRAAKPRGFRAVNVRCPNCGTTSTYEPGASVRLVEALGVHSLCEEAAWNELVEWRLAERAWKRARPETLAHIERVEHAQIAYLTAYLRHRARFLPETARDFEKDMEGRMRQFYQSLAHNKAWVEGGRARRG